MSAYVLVGGGWLGAGVGKESPACSERRGTMPIPQPSPASANGCTSPLRRSTSKPISFQLPRTPSNTKFAESDAGEVPRIPFFQALG